MLKIMTGGGMIKKKSFFILFWPLLIFILLRLPSVSESYWYGDEGIYAAVSSQMVQGKNLYQQIWDHKPPLIFWIFSVAGVFGWSIGLVLLKVLSIILGILTIILINNILKKEVDNLPRFISLLLFSFFLGSTILEGNVVNAEIIFIFFNLLGFFLLFNKKHFGLIGFLAYLSLMTKIPGAVEFGLFATVFMVVYLKEEGLNFVIEKFGRLAAGFFLPLLITLGYFYFQGTLTDFIYANITFNVNYSLAVDKALLIFGAGISNTLIKIFSLVSILIFTLFVYFKSYLSGSSFLAINFFNAQIFASLLSGKNYGHYFIQVLPGSVLLIGLIIQKIKKFFVQQKLDFSQLKYAFIVLVLFLPTFILFINVGKAAYYAPLDKYYLSFFNGYILDDEEAKTGFWWRSGQDIEKTKEFAGYLDNYYLEYDQAYIYTDKPWLTALTDRSLTNKYVVWFHLSYREEHLVEEMENITRADLVVIDNDIDLLELISEELKTNFTKIDGYNNFDIYQQSN